MFRDRQLDEIEDIKLDLDYTAGRPGFTRYGRWLHNASEKVSPRFKDWLLRQSLGYVGYVGEDILLKYNPLPGKPEAIIPLWLFEEVSEDHEIDLFSRRHRKQVTSELTYLGYAPFIRRVVSRDDVGFGINKQDHVAMCIEESRIPRRRILVLTDSPPDIRRAKDMGTVTAAVLTGYNSQENLMRVVPDYIFSSATQTFLRLNKRTIQVGI